MASRRLQGSDGIATLPIATAEVARDGTPATSGDRGEPATSGDGG
jgi:hypothetical protein